MSTTRLLISDLTYRELFVVEMDDDTSEFTNAVGPIKPAEIAATLADPQWDPDPYVADELSRYFTTRYRVVV